MDARRSAIPMLLLLVAGCAGGERSVPSPGAPPSPPTLGAPPPAPPPATPSATTPNAPSGSTPAAPSPSASGPATTTHAGAPPLPSSRLSEPVLAAGRPPIAWSAAVPLRGIEAMAFAGDGTLVAAGGCNGAVTIAGQSISCAATPANDFYVARFDRTGAALWLRRLGAYHPTELALAVDAASGESVVASSDAANELASTFVTRVAFDGSPRWTTTLAGKWARFQRVAMNARGDVAVTHWVEQGRPAAERVSLTVLAPDGRPRWTKMVPAPAGFIDPNIANVAIDSSGNVAVTHILTNPNGSGSSRGAVQGFAADGTSKWTLPLAADANARSIAVDPTGGWIASDGVPVPCVIRIGTDGKLRSQTCQKTSEYFSYVQPDASGGLVAFGSFERPMTIAGKTYNTAGKEDLILARFDAKLAPAWVAHFPGPAMEYARAVAMSGGGRVAIAGEIAGSIAIDGRTIRNETKTDFGPFVAVFGP